MKTLPDRMWYVLGMAALFSLPYRLGLLLPNPQWTWPLLTLLLTLLCALFLLAPEKPASAPAPRWIPLLLLSAGLLLRLYWIQRHPIDPALGDMLPLLQSAGERFLSGQNPYGNHHVPWPLPLTFFPGLWLSYLPAVATGIDLRYTGLLATLGTVLLWPRSLRALPALASFALLPVFAFFIVNGHTQPYTFWLCAFAFFYLRNQNLPAAFFLGLAVASRQPAVILLPAVFLGWWKDLGLRRACAPVFLCSAVIGLLCLPFCIADPDAFLRAPLRHYAELAATYSAQRSPHLLNTLGVANLLLPAGLGAWLPPLRLLLWIGGTVWIHLRCPGPVHRLRALAVLGILFTFFTPIPWLYAYFPFWLLAAFSLEPPPSRHE